MAIHPLKTTEIIRNNYLQYLKTIKPFQDADLRDEFARAIEQQDMLVKGPIVQIAPPYKQDVSIKGLVEEGVLSEKFKTLCSKALPYERRLYAHQVKAIRKAVNGRNLVVSTGTGSGKTEAFLIPILNHLLREEENGTLSTPGVRALLLYPMNALANDQMKRLRQILKIYPSITFGRYIGETEKEPKKALEVFREVYPEEPILENDLKSRQEMHEQPPHFLVTNYAMLEYLLLRPNSSPLFDGDTGKHWRFIVLDEAHIYDGANATEMAMLLRRVQNRVAGDQHGRIQTFATSATIGQGRQDYPAVAQFATNLFNKGIAWDDADERYQDVVGAEIKPLDTLGDSWGKGSAALYAALRGIIDGDITNVDNTLAKMEQIARAGNLPMTIIKSAHTAAISNSDFKVQRWLYALLQGDQNIRVLHNTLIDSPDMIHHVSGKVFPLEPNPDHVLIDLVALAVMARTGDEEMPLLPARYHLFARALEGAFVCLNKEKHQNGEPRLFLHRQKYCPTCKSRVFELANCTRCGTAYLIGNVETGSSLREQPEAFKIEASGSYLTQDSRVAFGEKAQGTGYYVFLGSQSEEDEDQYVTDHASIEEAAQNERLIQKWLCKICGQVQDNESPRYCHCDSKLVPVFKVDLGRKSTLKRCVSCSTRSSGGAVYRFLTGQDAPVSVIAGSLYNQIPEAKDEYAQRYPGKGRKLLNFTDSRQNAAFFAPFVERSHNRTVRRGLINRTLMASDDGRTGNMTLPDLIFPLVNQAEEIGLFPERMSPIEKKKRMAIWLMMDFAAIDRRISLEGLGLIHFEPIVSEDWLVPEFLTTAPWNLDRDGAYRLIRHMLNTLRWSSAVSYPLPDQNIHMETEFRPRNRLYYVRSEGANPIQGVFSWKPAVNHSNARLDYLKRYLSEQNVPEQDAAQAGILLLNNLWEYLSDVNNPWKSVFSGKLIQKYHLGYVHQVSHEMWKVVPTFNDLTGWTICDKCKNIYRPALGDICLTYACSGHLKPLSAESPEVVDNLYRQNYLSTDLYPLTAEEHTAQWTPQAGAEVQNKFIRGEINLLSCSTTFELGVDVGDLQSVLMRNMPPTTANYIQRAGRAGRRTDSAAFVVTFAQRRSHDLSYYNEPEKMVAGRMKPPYTQLTNEKIIRRHLHSIVFGDFFLWAKITKDIAFKNVGDFFAPEVHAHGRDLLKEYLDQRPEELKQKILEVIPAAMHPLFGIQSWKWVTDLTNDANKGVLDLACLEVEDDLDFVKKTIEEAQAEFNRTSKSGPLARMQVQLRIANQIKDRELLGFLGSRNVLPKYGFPTDVVEMRTSHLEATPEAQRIELSRDLRMAISEFAPGGEVIAAKKVWKSGGLRIHPRRAWPEKQYVICGNCKKFFQGNELPVTCTCGGRLDKPRHFIIPESGFVAMPEVDTPGEEPPQRIYASQQYFADYAEDKILEFSEPAEYVLDEGLHIPTTKRYSKYGWMALVNKGYDRGFRICTSCGWSEVISFSGAGEVRFGHGINRAGAHTNPVNKQQCNGQTIVKDLGHIYLTDVLEIRIEGHQGILRDYDAMRSMMYALLEGASETLGIRRSDIDGTLYPRALGETPSIVLYDTVPGGAGHVEKIKDKLYQAAENGLARVKNCNCGEDTSCYNCLRNYQNQFYHDYLQRIYAIKIFNLWLGL